jgi:hypothetical protein
MSFPWSAGGSRKTEQLLKAWVYLPITLTTTSSTTTTSNPAEETAAAVREPEIADATLRPASTIMTMSRIMIPNGVFMMSMMDPLALSPFGIFSTLPEFQVETGESSIRLTIGGHSKE